MAELTEAKTRDGQVSADALRQLRASNEAAEKVSGCVG